MWYGRIVEASGTMSRNGNASRMEQEHLINSTAQHLRSGLCSKVN